MPRPSNQQDQLLLATGRRLYPQWGCAGLTVRMLAQEAGVNPGMVHYHFGSKEGLLAALLQQTYDEMYAGLIERAGAVGPEQDRLAQAVTLLARFVRDHRAFVGRVWADVLAGEQVALEFLQRNGPRHLALLMPLLSATQSEPGTEDAPGLGKLVFVLGSVVAPILVAGGARALGVLPAALHAPLDREVLSDEAIQQRVDWALAALRKE
ncbi:TetR/AcrR family transcriptional regulator [Inhella proteolytica]|uniref:TetR/AcrR family transcriptional regulator n=1 Tax=Inhella proteolytica TaxID=2795029 RepID=A0A931J6H2_9BURK|nr:TetR/AcrR family transcriptional regulator [Inhella proteolytica]MBH9578683.1 TetR/AcrR family transcriptional regulator [Inhella proteolytica]